MIDILGWTSPHLHVYLKHFASASFESSWCSFISLRTLSIHHSLGFHRCLFPPTFSVVTSFATFLSSLLIITWPYHERRFWVTCVVIGLIVASLLNFSFLNLSFRVLPWINLSIFISVVCILCSSALCSAQYSLPYIKFGLIAVLYSMLFSLSGTSLSQNYY